MDAQEVVDRAEAAAIARFMAMREAFQPCWGARAVSSPRATTSSTRRPAPMINAVHVIVYTRQAEAVRAFFAGVLGLDSVDAGGGWPIFALPPAELAVHPTDGADGHELFLMCADLDATIAELKAKGVDVSGPITEERWGRLTAVQIPGAGTIQLYQPSHPSPLS
jgi:predicted enzyme related to lactoylglutathione lyase